MNDLENDYWDEFDDEFDKELIRQQMIVERWVCYIFIISVAVLYVANFLVRALGYHDAPVTLILNFILPLGIVAALYVLGQKKDYTVIFLGFRLPGVPMLIMFTALLAATIACWSHQSNPDTADFNITLSAAFALAIVPYSLNTIEKCYCVMTAEAIGFMLLATWLGDNYTSVVTIYFMLDIHRKSKCGAKCKCQ